MTPLNILHCHSTFALGGKEARAVRLMNAFGSEARHTILSAVPDAMGARDAIDPAIDASFPDDAAPALHGKPAPGRYLRLARYFKAFDLILTYNWGSMDAVMAHRLFGWMGLPPLIHHEDGFNADEANGLNWKRNLFRSVALPTAQALVVPSNTLARLARDVWVENMPIQRISNGIALTKYAQTPERDAIPGFVRRDGEVIVGTIAGLRAVKDLPLLVRAIALAPANVRLVIAGDGPERQAILDQALASGIADRVHLAGFLPDPWRYIGHFDMLALSSLSEQQPIAVMEAMAAGLPVISPAVGDVAEMLSPANARFVTARDAGAIGASIAVLAGSPELRQEIGKANRRMAEEQFDEQRMIAAYQSLYWRAAQGERIV